MDSCVIPDVGGTSYRIYRTSSGSWPGMRRARDRPQTRLTRSPRRIMRTVWPSFWRPSGSSGDISSVCRGAAFWHKSSIVYMPTRSLSRSGRYLCRLEGLSPRSDLEGTAGELPSGRRRTARGAGRQVCARRLHRRCSATPAGSADELRRNDLIESLQGTRNRFIDDPRSIDQRW